MAPRSTDPRRAPRGGANPPDDAPVVVPLRGGLASARRYTPRGRSVREAAQAEGSGRGDPFRPALRVVDGGARRSERGADGRARRSDPATGGERGAAEAEPERSRGGRRLPEQPERRAAPPVRVRKPPRKPRAGAVAGRKGERAATSARSGSAPRSASGAGTGRGALPRRPPAPPPLGDPRRRLRLGTVIAIALLAVLAGRLAQIQLTDAKAYGAKGLAIRLTTVPLPAPRGTIYDRNGETLAHSVEAKYISVDPTLVTDPERTATKLFEVLREWGVTKSELLTKVSPHKRPNGQAAMFEYLARGVDPSVGEQVAALGLDGIGVVADERRDVPNRDLAASVIGYTSRTEPADDPEVTGVTGIEYAYDDLLRGVKGSRTYEIGERDLAKEIPGGYTKVVKAKPGGSIELTIDRDLQYHAQSTLKQRAAEAQAIFAAATVIDSATGEVLAQASYPTYDAARPGEAPERHQLDACAQIVFDPGSVHKAIVLGAALEEGVVRPDSTITVGPTIVKGGKIYEDTHPYPEGTQLTIPGVLAMSSNVGTIKIADQLGKEKLYEYQRKFGLGTATGEGLPNESSGQLLPPKQWTGSSPGSIPIGHGVAVTTLQMAAVYAAIANDGTWVQPHLVRRTIEPGGEKSSVTAARSNRVLSPERAKELRTALEAVTTIPDATGRSGAIEGYRVAGKTGTGLFPKDGGYADGEVASFIGIAPADAPRYVVAVVMHTPNGTGGTVAGPAFRDLMSFTLGHFQVPPTGTKPPNFSVSP